MKKLLFILFPFYVAAQVVPDATIKTNTNNLVRNANPVLRASHSMINDEITDSKMSRIENNQVSGVNTYTITLGWVNAYTQGLTIPVFFASGNTGASTINVTSLGNKTIQLHGIGLMGGEIVANAPYTLIYDGTNFQLFGSTIGVVAISGTTNRITSSGGTNPVIDIAGTYVGQSSITTLGTIATGIWNASRLTAAYTPQGSGNSVWGVSGVSTADQSSIVAGLDGHVLRRNGSTLGFGSIDLSNSNSVGSSLLAVANGGTGTATPGIVAGTNVTVSGSWPNQTINSTGVSGLTTGTVPYAVSSTGLGNSELVRNSSGVYTLTGTSPTLFTIANGATSSVSLDANSSDSRLSITGPGISNTFNLLVYSSSYTVPRLTTFTSPGDLQIVTQPNFIITATSSSYPSNSPSHFNFYDPTPTGSTTSKQFKLTGYASSPANGIGIGISFETQTANTPTFKIGNTIESVSTDITNSSEDFDLVFSSVSGGSLGESFRLSSIGDITIGAGLAGSARNLIAAGSGSNVNWNIKSQGTSGEILFYNNNTEYFHITNDGRLYGKVLHNNAGSVTGTTNQYIASGSYTPTLTSVANVSSSISNGAQWIRVGNVVTVSGSADVTPTSNSTQTQLGISLPIASNIVNSNNCAGTTATNTDFQAGCILGDGTNDRAEMNFISQTTGQRRMFFTFQYLVN